MDERERSDPDLRPQFFAFLNRKPNRSSRSFQMSSSSHAAERIARQNQIDALCVDELWSKFVDLPLCAMQPQNGEAVTDGEVKSNNAKGISGTHVSA